MKLPTLPRNTTFTRLKKPSARLAIHDTGYGSLASSLGQASNTVARHTAIMKKHKYDREVEEYDQENRILKEKMSQHNLFLASITDEQGNIPVSQLPPEFMYPGGEQAKGAKALSQDGVETLIPGSVPAYEVRAFLNFQTTEMYIKDGRLRISNPELSEKFRQLHTTTAQNTFATELETSVEEGAAVRSANDEARIASLRAAGRFFEALIEADKSPNLKDDRKKNLRIEIEPELEADEYENVLNTFDTADTQSVALMADAYRILGQDYGDYRKGGGKLSKTAKLNMYRKFQTELDKARQKSLDDKKEYDFRIMKEGKFFLDNYHKDEFAVGYADRVLRNLLSLGTPRAIGLMEDIIVAIDNKVRVDKFSQLPRADRQAFIDAEDPQADDRKDFKERELLNKRNAMMIKKLEENDIDAFVEFRNAELPAPDITKENMLSGQTLAYLYNVSSTMLDIADSEGSNNSVLPKEAAEQYVQAFRGLKAEQKGEAARMVKTVYGDDAVSFFAHLQKEGMTPTESTLGQMYAKVSPVIADKVATGMEGIKNDPGWDDAHRTDIEEKFRELTDPLFFSTESARFKTMYDAVRAYLYTVSDGDSAKVPDLIEGAIDQCFGGIGTFKGMRIEMPDTDVKPYTFIQSIRDMNKKDLDDKGYVPLGSQFSSYQVVRGLNNGTIYPHKVNTNEYFLIHRDTGQALKTKTEEGDKVFTWNYRDIYTNQMAKDAITYKTGIKQADLAVLPELAALKKEAMKKNATERINIIDTLDNIENNIGF